MTCQFESVSVSSVEVSHLIQVWCALQTIHPCSTVPPPTHCIVTASAGVGGGQPWQLARQQCSVREAALCTQLYHPALVERSSRTDGDSQCSTQC